MIRLLYVAVLLVAGPVFAQTVPSVGTPDALDVATWNVEHFGNPASGPSDDQLQLDNVVAVMRQADIDLWALQETDIESEFNLLLDSLGAGFDGFWQADNTIFDVGYGFVYRTSVVQPLQINTIFEGSNYEFASRPPLEMRANIALPDTTIEVWFINLHMKCCSDEESYDRRVAASGILKAYTDGLQATGANVLILGDLNDELIESIHAGQTSPYQNFLDDNDYLFVTESFDMPGGSNDTETFCSNSSCTSGSVIDHMVATSDLGDDYQMDSADHFLELTTAIPSYTSTTSDHLPVYSRFDFLADPGGFPITIACSLNAANPPPLTIPAAGQTVFFDFDITNSSGGPYTAQFWLNTTGPVNLPEIGPITRTIGAGGIDLTLRLKMTAAAPAGTWTRICDIGDAYPTSQGTSQFSFDKSALFAPGDVPVNGVMTEAEFRAEFERALDAALAEQAAATAELPTSATLDGNYPNPFNPSTTLSFSLPETAEVSLVVFDVMGREVARLVDGTMEQGRHEVSFDASQLPSGMYFARFTAGSDIAQTQRLTLLK